MPTEAVHTDSATPAGTFTLARPPAGRSIPIMRQRVQTELHLALERCEAERNDPTGDDQALAIQASTVADFADALQHLTTLQRQRPTSGDLPRDLGFEIAEDLERLADWLVEHGHDADSPVSSSRLYQRALWLRGLADVSQP